MSLDGIGAYSGSLVGRFYGPAANGLGSAFSLTDGVGGVISGILFGKDDPALKLDTTGLLDLTAQKTFPSLTASGTGTNLSVGSPAIAVTFNPATQTYSLNTGLYSSYNVPNTTYGPAQKDAARSNPTYTVYQYDQTTAGAPNYAITARVLNPGAGNPSIALTYVSFVDLLFYNKTNHAFSTNPNIDTHFTSIYGMNTPAAQMPRNGTASYSAIAMGGGITGNSATNPGVFYYNLTGTAALNFNFGTSAMTGSLTLDGTEFVTAAARDFGTFAFAGSSGNNAAGLATFFGNFTTVGGSVQGFFYVPQGIELGAGFTLDTRVNGEDMYFSGGFAGKKN